MSQKLYSESSIQAIADAIRLKNGSSDTYTVEEMSQAIEDIPSGGNDFLIRLEGGIKLISRIRGVTLHQWSVHMYTLSNGNYYLTFGTDPMIIYLQVLMSRAEGSTAVMHYINTFQYNFSAVSGRLVHPYSWENTPTSAMLTGIVTDENIDSSDLVNNDTSLWFDKGGNAYNNNSPLIFQPSKMINIDTTRSHPLITRIFANEQNVTLGDYMNGVEPINLGEIVTVRSADIPSGFDLDTIDKGYLLYTHNNMYILAVGDSNWSGVKVDGNGKLNAETNQVNYSTQNWNSCPSETSGNLRTLPIVQRTGRPPFCEGNNDNYTTNMMYNTQDILDPDGNVVVAANISIADFKSIIFKLS